MRMVAKILLILCVLTGIPAGAIAEDSPASHKYDAVMMEMEGKLYFYLLNEKDEVVSNQGVSGKVTFKMVSGVKVKAELAKFGDNAFVVNGPVDAFTKAEATFKMEGVNVNANFKNTYSAGIEQSGYICPMHPEEVRADKGMKCPKCGMQMPAGHKCAMMGEMHGGDAAEHDHGGNAGDKGEGHEAHSDSHEGHGVHGQCPKCGMGLKVKTFKTYLPEKSNRR